MKTLVLLIVLAGCDDYLAPADGPAHVDAPRHLPDAIQVIEYSVSAAPTAVTVSTPGTVVVDITIQRVGQAQPIDLSVRGLPPNVTAAIDPVTIAADADTAQLTFTVSAPTTGVVKLDATGFVRHGEAAGSVVRTVDISVTGT